MNENKNTVRALKELRKAQRDISDLPPTLLMEDDKQRKTLVSHMLSNVPYPINKEEKETLAKIMVDALEWGWRTSMTDTQYKAWQKEDEKRKTEEENIKLMLSRERMPEKKSIKVVW